jgi:hypothetical protein
MDGSSTESGRLKERNKRRKENEMLRNEEGEDSGKIKGS